MTVLPVLLALVAAGYCAVNDLLPPKWLLSLSGRGGADGAPEEGSTAAKTEGYREGEPEFLVDEVRELEGKEKAAKGSLDHDGDVGPGTEADSRGGSQNVSGRGTDGKREGLGPPRWGWWWGQGGGASSSGFRGEGGEG